MSEEKKQLSEVELDAVVGGSDSLTTVVSTVINGVNIVSAGLVGALFAALPLDSPGMYLKGGKLP